MPEPLDQKPNIYGTLAGPESEKNASESEKLGSDLKGLQQHADAPKLEGYLMLRSIGNGAYAQVWEAIQLRTRRLVAVKVFHKKGILHWNLLQREADRMIRLDKHPHIVSLLDADLRGEIPYYVMDLAEAGSLENVIQDRKNTPITPPDVFQAATWMQEIAEALSYVHAREIVHCDLKPANVLLDQEGHVRVADFGHSLVLTDSGGALGSLFYMAPEQTTAEDQGHITQPDVRWDIYALGCTVYTLLSGQPPHQDIEIELEMTPILATCLKIYRKAIETQTCPIFTPSPRAGSIKIFPPLWLSACKSIPTNATTTWTKF
jgi:serine/threonine protein kinase